MRYYYDYKNYYRSSKGNIVIITKKEYMEKTGESAYIIDRLKNSIGPYQYNDYILMKPPFDYKKKLSNPNCNGLIPIDWKLSNLVKYLWNLGLITTGVDQGREKGRKSDTKKGSIYLYGFISFERNPEIPYRKVMGTNADEAFIGKTKLIKLFGEENIVELVKPNGLFGQEKQRWDEKMLDKYPDKIIFSGTSIKFNEDMIKWMYTKLDIRYPDHSKAHKGGRMKYN